MYFYPVEVNYSPLLIEAKAPALERGPWVTVNPPISRAFAEEPAKFKIKADSWRIVNPWVKIPIVAPEKTQESPLLLEMKDVVFVCHKN